MSHELYFVPVLAKALQAHDVRRSLESALGVIERLGQEAGYEEGYGNYRRFLLEASARRRLLDEYDMRTAILENATGTLGETKHGEVSFATASDCGGGLKDDYYTLCRACRPHSRPPSLQLMRDTQQIAEWVLTSLCTRQLVADASPGHYVLRLDMGLVVWEATLNADDLIWAEAFAGRDLPLAAEAGECRRQASREVRIPDSHLLLYVFPGIENGSIEIELML